MINWSRYLESLCNAYAQWWQIYTITDVVGQKRVESEPSPFLFDFGFMVQTVERDREEKGKGEEKIERLSVLEGLRKYASEHVLLVGRPGSGKSTALARLLLEEAGKARTPLNPPLVREEEDCSTHSFTSDAQESLAPPLIWEAGRVKIPVLVELRYYRTEILDLIQDFLQRHDPNLTVDAETLKSWLRQGQLLLLVDGLNELPSEEARRDLQKFRQDYQKTTPMIFTRRDLGVGGDLGITKKLEMQPLTQAQMQQFVRAYLPGQGEQMLRQLGSRLREFGQTPLLLWMLCSLFRAMGKVPPNLGKVFRQFALSYDRKLKQDIPISKESRRWWHRLLEHLAWVMTSGEAKTDLQVAIPRQKAQAVLTEFLAGKVAHPEDCALGWLEDLLNHHLIQLGANNQIEFRHQLIQEYYTAESLLKLLSSLGDDELKREYLNYLKWTEPLVLMLELVEDEVQAVRVVKLALEVDLRLGARLAGAVKPEFQAQTIDLIANLKIPQPLKIRLLGTTQSINTISHLSKAFKENKHQPQFCRRIVWALAQVGRATIPIIREQALKHEHIKVRYEAVYALGQIGSEAVIPALRQALEDKDPQVTSIAKNVLVKITNEATINTLVKALEDKSFKVRKEAVRALGSMAGEVAISYLERALTDEKMAVRYTAILELEEIRSEAVILPLIRALADKEFEVCRSAAEALKEIFGKDVVPALLPFLEDKFSENCCGAIYALKIIGDDEAISALRQALANKDYKVRRSAVKALREIGSNAVIPAMLQVLSDEDFEVRKNAAKAVVEIDWKAEGLTALYQALADEAPEVRRGAAEILGRTPNEATIPALCRALADEDSGVRRSAAEALGRISSRAVIPILRKAMADKDSGVSRTAAKALVKKIDEDFGASTSVESRDDTAISALLQDLKSENFEVHNLSEESLVPTQDSTILDALDKHLKIADCKSRWQVAFELEKKGEEIAVPTLDEILNHGNLNDRKKAIEALQGIKNEVIIPILSRALTDQEYKIRWKAIEALKNIRNEAAIPVLSQALEHEDYVIRENAVAALGKFRSEATIPVLSQALADKAPGVRWKAIEALGNIPTEAVIPVLLPALEHEDPEVCRKATAVFEKIGSPELLPRLSQQLLLATTTSDVSDTLLNVCAEIQRRCQFYNYTLTQKILAPEPQTYIPPIQHEPIPLSYILHLSDLHFGTLDQANHWSNQLAADLYNDLSIPHLDALILSGDIANYSTLEEYKAAEQFLQNLHQDFSLSPDQIILVPGNHDLNWKLAKKAYKLIDRDDYDGELKEDHYIEVDESVIRVRDEAEYKQRFAHFSQFYETIKQNPYPLDYDQQYTLDHLKEQNLLILGLNSAWQLDHHYKSRASINTNALSNALTQIRRNPDYKNSLKIAVWHHPLDSPWNDRITDQGFLEQLAVNGFRFFLHGHIHKAETSLYRYDMSTNGRKLDRICAGTFGAPVREWVPGYPLQYNLLKIADNQLTVITRRREELNGAWKPDARWLQGAGKTPLDYYEISLS